MPNKSNFFGMKKTIHPHSAAFAYLTRASIENPALKTK